jgi:anhydro-N-acetylmuramic acid kinase
MKPRGPSRGGSGRGGKLPARGGQSTGQRHRSAERAHAPWRRLVGVMSGTSLDGVDCVLASLRGSPPRLDWRLDAHRAAPFPAALRRRLLATAEGGAATAEELARLHFALGELYAAAVLELLSEARVGPGELAGIGLSGQTVFHRSARAEPGGGMTLQLGSAAIAAERVGARVVSDFRAADVAAGGEGAPLVPYADWLLFASRDEGRVVLNVGGIANLTALPAGARAADVVAFDTGPGNMVMDGLVQLLSGGRETRDEGGGRAERGRPDDGLVAAALADPFFALAPPRSTGRERFGRAFVERWVADGRAHGLADDDLVASACELTAHSVADAVQRHVAPRFPVQAVYVAGGGAHNPALLAALGSRLAPLRVAASTALAVPPECREALAFAVLAHETLAGRPSNLPQVTGAARAVVLGQVTGEPRGTA